MSGKKNVAADNATGRPSVTIDAGLQANPSTKPHKVTDRASVVISS
jgi:hypothetical protein